MTDIAKWPLTWSIIVSLIAIIVYKTLCTVLKYRRWAKTFENLPGVNSYHWFYGTLHKFPGANEKGLEFDFNNMLSKPRFKRSWVGPFSPVIVLYHPDLVRLTLKTSEPKPRLMGGVIASIYQMGIGWLGEGLLLGNGPRWARSRRLLTPAFHFDILKPYITVKNRATEILLEKMQEHADSGKPFVVFHNVSLCLLDILLQCAFNHESNCQIGGKDEYIQSVVELLELWLERSLKPWLFIDPIYHLFPHGRRWYKLCKYVHSVSEDLINRRRQVLNEKKSAVDGGCAKKRMLSFVDVLLTARDADGNGMTSLEIQNEADTFLFAGFDTTTSGIGWTLYSLARWPKHQARVQQEVDTILENRNSDDITWEDLHRLTYLTACIKEALRNYSTVPLTARQTTKPLTIDGHEIPIGTQVVVHLWCLHHNPHVWIQPNDFIPERFLEGNAEKMDPFQFIPFSAGPRNCIGQNFAMHEMKVVVAKICRRFSFSLDPDHKLERHNKAHKTIVKKSMEEKLHLDQLSKKEAIVKERRRQRQEIYALNKIMSELEYETHNDRLMKTNG